MLREPLRRSDITQSYPWLVAFSFGLLHGLGFAGALAEIGLPRGEIPLALFAFNAGVDVGQVRHLSSSNSGASFIHCSVWTLALSIALRIIRCASAASPQ